MMNTKTVVFFLVAVAFLATCCGARNTLKRLLNGKRGYYTDNDGYIDDEGHYHCEGYYTCTCNITSYTYDDTGRDPSERDEFGGYVYDDIFACAYFPYFGTFSAPASIRCNNLCNGCCECHDGKTDRDARCGTSCHIT